MAEGKQSADVEADKKICQKNKDEGCQKNKDEGSDTPAKKLKKLESKETAKAQKDKEAWKSVKLKKLQLKKKRKESKQRGYDFKVVLKAKKLWEEMRREDCPADKRIELVTTLHSLVKDYIVKMVFAHDASRIVQWLLKLGTNEIRTSIIKTLIPSVKLMVQKKYSSTCVKRMLKYSTSQCRRLVIRELQENVVNLMSHAVAAPVVNYAYDKWSCPFDKMVFQCKFSGEYYKLILETGRRVRSIRDIISISPTVRTIVLNSVNCTLLHILNKGLVFSTLIQAVLIEYLSVCSEEGKSEVFALLRPHVIELIRTKEGVRLSMMCCWNSITKEKKKFMTGLKGKVVETALMEYGHFFLLTLIDCVDDTVALNKYILRELMKDIPTVAADEYGRRVILYALVHRDSMYFHPRIINMLKGGDKSEMLKKPASVRQEEILAAVLPFCMESVISNVSVWFFSGSMAMVALAILREGSGEKWVQAINEVVKYLCEDHWVVEDDKKYPLVEHSGCHLVFKKLIQQDCKSPSRSETFSMQLALELTEERILNWTEHNRSCFLLNLLFESGVESAVQTLKEKCTEKVVDKAMQQTTVGAKIFLKHLKGE